VTALSSARPRRLPDQETSLKASIRFDTILRMSSTAWTWRIVLVRPRNPLNIGAAARAMANFGFPELVVVAPYAPVWQETRSAVGAEEIISSARAVDHLTEAISDSRLVVGTTAGSRRNLDRELIPLDRLSSWLRGVKTRAARRMSEAVPAGGGQAALLFGSEKTGLSREDMSYCHGLVRIPTVSDCPSMNLGQAVAVCCYEMTQFQPDTVRDGTGTKLPSARVYLSQPAAVHSVNHVFDRAVRVLDEVGYLKPKSRNATLLKLRRVMFDRKLTNNDVKILGSVLAQIEWKLTFQK
jgi:TrmH family RNA methyltransferase